MVVDIVRRLLELYELLLLGRVLLSYFPISPSSPMAGVSHFLYTVTEPVLGPLRRVIPPLGGIGLDLSPMVAFLVIGILIQAV